ncbi:MAG: class I SAM-dependent DNA methyltransferase, partial [Bacteroidetes bacterium]
RVQNIKKFRDNPHLFGSIRKPKNDYLFVPQMSSAIREYIPIGFLKKGTIPLGPHFFIDNATMYYFGVLTSKMHMTWVKYTCGRLKSDYRYSNSIVYNNFPWAKEVSEKNKKKIEEKAQKILNVRAEFPRSSLADLYHPLTMPLKLSKAHQDLDKAVDLCYRSQVFKNDNSRIEFLFDLYNEYTSPMFNKKKKKK